MENELEANSIFSNIIKKISENRLKQLLEIVSKNYPTKFKYKDINTEVEYLKDHIIFKSYIKNTLPTTISSQPTTISSQPTTISSQPTTISSQPTTISSQPTRLQKENQCCARVWNDYIFDRSNMTKITDLPELFKVNDFKNINIKKFNSAYIIGLQCKKKKYKESNYCKLHKNHLIHGDFTELPSKEICYHFIKDGKYL
jgi:hypothetical protein